MSQEIRDGLLHEINPILVAEVDAFADMLEQRNLARDAAICLEQELAAAEAENAKLREVIAHATRRIGQVPRHGPSFAECVYCELLLILARGGS